ncbi:MAG: exodeoxyribonuclease VII large subunit [Candidatus Methanoplasma sp.]|jgi:exodeoxyribonuclease VII large subunit|nr:exodeoxyribonuclease VII large subunit [Candidatus Methanoplasma sp.]
MAETVTVRQLNERVRSLLSDSAAVRDVWVAGEISGLKKYPSGHYYFTLKDADSEIRAVMFSRYRPRLDFEPADSMMVSALGSAGIYVERGQYQFSVESMRRSGVGDLYLAFEALKRKLGAEGLFDAGRKRSLPPYPRVIGVVTSPAGAAIHDIITTSRRLFPADILLAPALVQGAGAAESIASGIALLNRHGVDAIIVGRGGGSMEDLWAFNEEAVARAIAASAAPVISAVGHETDFTIADMVADVRAPTPTGAAELALRDAGEIRRQLDSEASRAARALRSAADRARSRFAVLDSKLSPQRAAERAAMLSMRLDELSGRAASALEKALSSARSRLAVAESAAGARASPAEPARRELERFSERLEGVSPMSVLGRGYCFLTGPGGEAVSSARSLRPGSAIGIRMMDGSAEAEISEVRMDER